MENNIFKCRCNSERKGNSCEELVFVVNPATSPPPIDKSEISVAILVAALAVLFLVILGIFIYCVW